MGKKKFRNYLIDKQFQLKYMFLVFAFLVLVSSGVFASFFIGFKLAIYDNTSFKKTLADLKAIDRMAGEESMRRKLAKDKGDITFDMNQTKKDIEAKKLSDQQNALFNAILSSITQNTLLILLVLVALVTFATLFVTHKIAGPMYRIHMLLSQIKEGTLNVNFKLRKGDQLQGIADTLNGLFGTYRATINELTAKSTGLIAKCDTLMNKVSDFDIKNEIENIRHDSIEINNICGKLHKEEPKA
jgi:methyl-accepting chemotaxis protein